MQLHHPDETLAEYEERLQNMAVAKLLLRQGNFLKETPETRQNFLHQLDRLMGTEARATRDYATWIQRKRAFEDMDRLLRKSGR